MPESLRVKACLLTYEQASAQKVNFDKSAISFSHNVSTSEQASLGAIFGVPVVPHQGKYLGLPSMAG